jgi:hypothetical protein
MLAKTAQRLRHKHQRVSTADLIAASELAFGLARLRGHAQPLRADVLDGLTGALIKDALTAPAPWSIRGPLPRGTDPLLVEMVAEFCGEAIGELAAGTPRPPLVGDAFAQLEEVGIRLGERVEIEIDPLDESVRKEREVLHRLSILEIAGVTRVRAADLRRGYRIGERWSLERVITTEPTLIERAVYGATLMEAARARLEEELVRATGAEALVAALEAALSAGLGDLIGTLVAEAREAIERETEMAKVGAAIARLRVMAHALADTSAALSPLLAGAVERAIWLFEGLDGPHRPFARPEVLAVVALRDCLTDEELLPPASAEAVLAVLRRRAQAENAPPSLRGAALGALWSVHDAVYAADAVASANTLAIPDIMLGDFLSGVFLLAREELMRSPLLGIVDERLRGLTRQDFLVALPSLRRSFSFFPPRERLAIADRLVRPTGGDAHALVAPIASADLIQRGAQLEAALYERLAEFGLEPQS